MERCEGCGFTYDEGAAGGAGAAVVDEARRLGELLLRHPAGALARRREPSTWSALEYACHVRDVLLVQRERALLVRRADHPDFTPMGRDERVEHEGYAEQAPADVARQLADAAALYANVLARLDDAAWARTAIYNFPAPQERTLRWMAVHTVHEARHHRLDAEAQLA